MHNYVPVPLEEVTQAPTGGSLRARLRSTRRWTTIARSRSSAAATTRNATVVRRWFGLRNEGTEGWVCTTTCCWQPSIIRMTPSCRSGQRKRLENSQFRPGSILIKYFRNIAPGDLKMLLPRVRRW